MTTMDKAWSNWQRKLYISIRSILIQVNRERLRINNLQYRGYEDVWYGVWDTFLNMNIARFESVGLIPQPRIVRRFGKEGKERITWRIPDFGIVRHIGRRRGYSRGRRVWIEEQSRLVAIIEIKCVPINNSPLLVLDALNEARGDLINQVELFFEANPDVDSIIGISVAGDWWSYEKFTRGNNPTVQRKKRDTDGYISSSDLPSSQEHDGSERSQSEDSDSESGDESNEDSKQGPNNDNSGSDSDSGNGSTEDSGDESTDEDDDVGSNHSNSIGSNQDNHPADESGDRANDNNDNNDNETSETDSSKDELDVISQDEDPIAEGYVPYRRCRSISGGLKHFYQLQTDSSNAAITALFEAIRDLPSCRDVFEQPF
ncbi:uncharacterized protein FOMMEDRAFT_30981 [Fomitiporia mediterranea MF3/22]|uniref:uncharacterized protein n=1 Tax=Fomitiporia mediterranea (strain MF3/22) TaxID=694068 RepID=UPI00044094E8|nr:uncharacterized protein FOMMEDRAFT_30981 [Fomitiporia mediterranea MF3/22]EJC99674.1 hypothetical protein FOMMEDRAFT_30981 [Fomitiporia mediterranea MF3/22]